MDARERVNDLLSVWERRRKHGESVSPEELCRDDPTLLDEVRRRVAALRAFEPALPDRTLEAKDTGPWFHRLPDESPPGIPGYEILAVLGVGGMGIVYQARQTRLKRVVALKMVRSGHRATAEELERFRAEAEALARLQHPNIVQVYEVGEYDGQPYFSLEFVSGGSLDRRLDGTPMAERPAAELVATLAAAAHAAHAAGVVHRDLKPANVLLQIAFTAENAETLTGRNPEAGIQPVPVAASTATSTTNIIPKITDFGLAKQLDTDSGQTASGTVLGTPSYMAPEQAAGRIKEVGASADVYALGAILYELLTGRPPFQGATAWETVAQVIADEPVPPSRLRPRLSRDLETICLKCLEKPTDRRYATAAALADDLRRFLAGESILARPAGAWVRWGKWARRRPTAAALFSILVVGLPAVVILLAVSLREAEGRAAAVQDLESARGDLARLRNEREVEEGRLAALKAEQRRATYALDMRAALGLWDRGDVAGLRRELARYEGDDAADLRQFEWHYLRQLTRSHLHHIPANAPTDSDPERLWPALRGAWDFAAYPELAGLGGAWAFDPARHRLAVGGADGVVRLFDTAAGKVLTALAGHTGSVVAVAFGPDGSIASGGADGTVRVWDAAGAEVVAFTGHGPAALTGVTVVADGRLAASRSADGVGLVWEIRTGRVVRRLPERVVGTPALSADGTWVAAGVDDKSNEARVWAVDTGEAAYSLRGHGAPVDAVAFHPRFGPKFQWVATASRDRSVKLWNAGKDRIAYRGHAEAPARLAFSPDGNRLASVTSAGEVLVWDATRDPEYRVMRADQQNAHTTAVAVVASSPDGGHVLTANTDWFGESQVKVWRPRTGEMLLQLRVGERTDTPFPDVVLAAALSPDGALCAFAAGSPDRPGEPAEVQIRAVATGTQGPQLPVPAALPHAIAFSPDGRLLAVAAVNRAVALYEVKSGHPAGTFAAPPAIRPTPTAREVSSDLRARERIFPQFPGPMAVAFSPDGRLVAVGHTDGGITVWTRDGSVGPVTCGGHSGRVNAVAFSPDGKTLASAGDDGVRLWNAADGTPSVAVAGHGGAAVGGLAFTPDGGRLATAGEDGTVRLWEPATGREVFALRADAAAVRTLAFRSDGRALITGHGDGAVRIWFAAPEPPPPPKPARKP